MKVDGGVGGLDLAPFAAKKAEDEGYDGVWTAETGHDPFFPLLLAAEHTERIELGTGIAVAFARSPMNLAAVANDLQLYSKGRFILGLGSQIKAHIEKRFSMPWSHPAPRMREFIMAMRATWDSWHNGTKLDFRGDFYSHTLMTPFFSPGPSEYGAPKVFLAAVGALMTEVAAEAGDGLLCHAFTTERYLREVTLPAIDKGLATAGKTRADFQISGPGFIVTGSDEKEFAQAASAIRQQIAFYGSTPAYRPVLELHGWGDLQTELNGLSKQGEWVQMGTLITDEILDTFAVVAEKPEDVPAKLIGRYGDCIDRIAFYAPYRSKDPELFQRMISELKDAPAPTR
ncbi:MAG TPA: LLM class F420-dependent oxidoreductase [Acidimicrobiales bacterium]|nr:LLM class F420-dependent oxidoreductase [Acidimicrobiales bacterium]